MINLHKSIDIKEALNMRVQVSVDNRVVIEKKADSLLSNFIRLLHANAGANNADGDYFDSDDGRDALDNRRRLLTRYRTYTYGSAGNSGGIQILDKSPPLHLDFDPNNNNRGDIAIQGSTNGLINMWTRDSNLSSFYCVSDNSDGSDRSDNSIYDGYLWEANIDPVTNEVTVGSPVDLTSADLSNFDGDAVIKSFNRRHVSAAYENFGHAQILLGREYSSEPVAIENQWMFEDVTPYFEQTGTSVSAPAVSTNDSEIEFSETFTNNTSYNIPINAVGIRADNDNNEPCLIARDPASFTIPSSSAVTITYFFTVTNSGDGGVMAQFNELLYRQLARTDRELPDIFNNNINQNHSPWNFRMAGPGGDSRYGEREHNNPPGRNIGPVLGSSTTSVSNTDFALQDPIPHGKSDGRLFNYGAAVEDFQIDITNGKAYFDVSRIFENRGSTSIDINETGVYGASSERIREYPDSTHLIARHTLASTQSIPAGELVKLTYRFEVNV